MSSGLDPSGVPAGTANATLGQSPGNDTASLSSFASAPELTSVSTFTSNSTVIAVLPTSSRATTHLSEASTTAVTTSTLVRATLVKATSLSSTGSTPAPAVSSAPRSTTIMASSSSKSAFASASDSTTAEAVASAASATSSQAAAASSPAPAAPAPSSASSVSSSSVSLIPSSSGSAAASPSSGPSPLPSSSSTQHAGAESPVSSSAIGTAASSAAGTVSSSSAGEKSGPLSAVPSPASSSPTTPATSSGSAVSSTENSNKPLSSGSATITSGPSQAKSASTPNVIDVPGSTTISTVTDAAQTTFSTPVSIAVTAPDGRTTFSAPPLVTSVLPSTRTDGMVVQVTHVIANPNSNLNALNHHSFFDNAGAVAGTFVAVGVVATALAALLLCFIRRRRRRARRARLESRLPHFPFHDDPATPQTAERRSISVIPMNMDDPFAEPAQTRPSLLFRSAGSPEGRFVEYEGPFADYRPSERGNGAFGYHDAPEADRAPSRAVSTPSIYPPSLPDDGTDRDSMYEHEVHISPPLRAHPASFVPDYAPLERRNPLRPSTGESSQLRDLDARHPPLLARPPPMLQTSSFGYASSSTDHGSSADGPQTPRSESATAVGSVHSGDEKDKVGVTHGLQRPASPQSVFLRRQLSKPLAESFSIPAELRRLSIVGNESQEYTPVAL